MDFSFNAGFNIQNTHSHHSLGKIGGESRGICDVEVDDLFGYLVLIKDGVGGYNRSAIFNVVEDMSVKAKLAIPVQQDLNVDIPADISISKFRKTWGLLSNNLHPVAALRRSMPFFQSYEHLRKERKLVT